MVLRLIIAWARTEDVPSETPSDHRETVNPAMRATLGQGYGEAGMFGPRCQDRFQGAANKIDRDPDDPGIQKYCAINPRPNGAGQSGPEVVWLFSCFRLPN